jgi:hypothetical protein
LFSYALASLDRDPERNLLIGRAHELMQRAHGLLKFLGELLVLLIAPGVAQTPELALQAGHAVMELAVELLQFMGKAFQIFWTGDSL